MSFEELHDGSEGVFADLYLADIPHGIGKEIDIKDMKKVCDFDLQEHSCNSEIIPIE